MGYLKPLLQEMNNWLHAQSETTTSTVFVCVFLGGSAAFRLNMIMPVLMQPSKEIPLVMLKMCIIISTFRFSFPGSIMKAVGSSQLAALPSSAPPVCLLLVSDCSLSFFFRFSSSLSFQSSPIPALSLQYIMTVFAVVFIGFNFQRMHSRNF